MATKECYEKINVSMMNVRKLYTKFTGTKMGSWSSPEAWQCRCWPSTTRRGCREGQDHLPAYNQALTGVHLPVGKYHQKNCMYRHTKKNYKSTKCCSMRSISARTFLLRRLQPMLPFGQKNLPSGHSPLPLTKNYFLHQRLYLIFWFISILPQRRYQCSSCEKNIGGGGVILL